MPLPAQRTVALVPTVRFATLGFALAWIIATGCTSDGAATPDTGFEAPADTSDVFVELPPAPVLTVAAFEGVQLGAWDWGAPCRVPVDEVVGAVRPRVSRSYTIDIAATDGGFVMSFDDVTVSRQGLTGPDADDALYRHLAVLSDMRLGPDGSFVEFVDLEGDLAELAAGAGTSAPAGIVAVLVRQPVVTESILARTILGWYGFWLDHARLPVSPDRLDDEQVRARTAGSTRVFTESFAAPVSAGGLWGPTPDGAVWLTYSERATDASMGRVVVSAIVDPANRRPSYVVTTIGGFSSGGTEIFAAQDRRLVTFDWENAVGCE